MGPALESISNMGQTILNLARQFTFKDAVDVAIVTVLLYGVIKLVRETRAGQLVKGIILLVVLLLAGALLFLLVFRPDITQEFFMNRADAALANGNYSKAVTNSSKS